MDTRDNASGRSTYQRSYVCLPEYVSECLGRSYALFLHPCEHDSDTRPSIFASKLVIAIGLIVDFIAHILLRYNESKCKTREGRVKDTLETMGSSIFLGGFSTFLGVIPLAFSTSTVLRTVFTSLVAMVVLSLSHGLILLPVILSVAGPYTDEREDYPNHSRGRKSSSEVASLKGDAGLTFESSSTDAGSPAKSLSSSEAL
jgi:uncharacterized membrane protein